MSKSAKHPCQECIYFEACGANAHTEPCKDKTSRRTKKRADKNGVVEYSVCTPYPYESVKCYTLKQAKHARTLFKKRGRYSSIACLLENGNDHILA